jgi:hypothetical protein
MDRRDFMKAAAFATAGAVAGPTLIRRAGSLLESPALAAPSGTLFGCSAQEYAGKSREQLIAYLEDVAGAPFDTVHNRFPWQTSLVNGYSKWITESGRMPILSWFTRGNNGDVAWRPIANGVHDARIRSEAKAIASAGWPALFCFHKEPENEPNLGNANDWRAAHDRVYEIFQQEGATNVTFIACLMASTFKGSAGGAGAWLPPRYDMLGVDGYNRNVGGNWRTFETIFRPALNVARDRSEPLYVIELGCVEGAPGRKGDWMRESAATVAGWSEIVGVSYNHEAGNSGKDANMNYRVDTSSSSAQGFRDMVQHAAFGAGGDGGGGGDGGSGGGDGGVVDPSCEVPRRKLGHRREQVATLRAKLDRLRRKNRRLRARSSA